MRKPQTISERQLAKGQTVNNVMKWIAVQSLHTQPIVTIEFKKPQIGKS